MSNYIQSISYAKLAKYDQTRIDLPIRKYVLITNLLREEEQKEKQSNEDEDMMLLEQNWFESCLNELDKEEEQEELSVQQSQLTKPNLHLKAFYNFQNGKGFLFCTSSL